MNPRWIAGTAALLIAAGVPAAAHARPVSAAKDGKPNILVVMTDDEALTDVAAMPNVRRLLAARGTSFADAIDSFPLCCPSRATFITGQYAHNHGALGNFYPYGWYGLKHRENILPVWLQKAGYRTALIGKWLNGYGARDAHGEVPAGFDIWRGLLDVSAYDYFNFVMNVNGVLRSWGDKDFARKLVEFAKIEVTPNPSGFQGLLAKLRAVFGPAPYTYWGKHDAKDYSPDVTGKVTEDLVRKEGSSRKPFFIWWAPAAPHREDVAVTLLGRPGPDPRPAPRYAARSKLFTLPRTASFNEAAFDDKPANMRDHATPLTDKQIAQLQLDYEGRMGSLLAVDDHVKRLVDVLAATHQLSNTLIVFVSDNGWLQGQHRIPGDKFLPYEESLRVPFILRGPGVPAGRTVHGQVTNVDFAETLLDAAHAKAGRTEDGISLLPAVDAPSRRPDRALLIEAPRPLFEQAVPVNAWDRPWKGVRTDRYTFVHYPEAGDEELYDRDKDPAELRNVVGDPAYAHVRDYLAAKLAKLEHCRGPACSAVPAALEPARRPGPRARRALSLSGHTRTVKSAGDGTVEDRGTVTGTPFGDGVVTLDGRLADGRLTGTFRLSFADGSVSGSVSAPFTIQGNEIDFVGTGRLTGGTGAYRGVTSGTLQVHDHNTLDGQSGTLTVMGAATY